MKKNFKFLLIAAAALSFAACDPDQKDPVTPGPGNEPEPEPEVELNQNLEFTLEVTTVEAELAKIKVNHNGEAKDTWYGFYTTDVEGDDLSLISEEVDALLEDGKVTGLKKQKSTTVTLRGLEPATDYKYIAFGLSDEGELYGSPASVTFTTLKGEVQFKENSAWTVTYSGPGKINGTDYDHTVTVTSTDSNPYFITAVSKADFETLGIAAIAEDNLAYLKEYLAYFNENQGTNYTLSDILFQGTGTDALMLEAGIDWIALAVGVGTDGELNGLYAKSAVITVEEEEPTEAYSSWIGTWTWTGANGVAWDITFEKGINNVHYRMSGWEGAEAEGLYVKVDWMAEDELWAIYTQSLGTYNFGSAGDGEILFVGSDAEGYFYPSIGLPICVGGFAEDGSRVVYGYTEETEEGLFGFSLMHFIAQIGTQWYGITNTSEWPTFPITITPAARTTRSSESAAAENVQVVTNLVRPYKTFGSAR